MNVSCISWILLSQVIAGIFSLVAEDTRLDLHEVEDFSDTSLVRTATVQRSETEVFLAAKLRTQSELLAARIGTNSNSNSDPMILFQAHARLARACFEHAEFAATADEREPLALEGISVSSFLRSASKSGTSQRGQAAYLLGLNKGQLARTKTLGALRLVDEMSSLFTEARLLDPEADFRGADRCLGLLYLQAPGWPISVGNRSKARKFLNDALEEGRGFPENWINWMEALTQWGEFSVAQEALSGYRAATQQFREKFSGDFWEWAWVDWERRLRQIEKRVSEQKRLGIESNR